MSKPSKAVAAAATSQAHRTTSVQLSDVQKEARNVRVLELQFAQKEEELGLIKEKLNELYFKTLPDMLDEIGIDRIGIPAEGNFPACDYILAPYYSASISSKWDDDKREAAFQILNKYKAEDLIKTEVVAALPKGSLALAQKLQAAAKKLKIKTTLDKSVHTSTLKAWLKEFYETKKKTMPESDLEKIGGRVGRVVKLSERDE